MRPSVRQLECAVAVADARHFGRAARACALSQPALSAQVRALEDALGVQLFERGRRGVTISRAGEEVVARARVALRALDDLGDAARALREPLAGPLHLGVIPTVAPYLLPRRLGGVRRRHPRLVLYLHEEKTDDLLRDLRAGRLDALLLALPVPGDDLDALPLFDEPFLLVVSAKHALARRRASRVAEDDLAGEPVLLLEDGHCLRDQALAICARAGAREADRVRASSLGTLVEMVANGLGVTLVPESAVAVELRGRRELAVLPFRAPAPRRRIGLVWRRASARADEFRRLGELLRPGRRSAPGPAPV